MVNNEQHNPLVLIVDDVPENLQVLYKILTSENYSFALATNGQETFEILEKQLPDLILLDIMLPDTNGFEICKKIKENNATKNIPIIFLTAVVENEDKLNAFRIGAADYITKPFEEEEVLRRVKTHVQLKQLKDALKKYAPEVEEVKILISD